MDINSTSKMSQIATNNVISPVGVEIVAEVSGQYGGEEVHGASESEKLADAAEELGMSTSERHDRKSIEERSVRMGRGANLEALARIADYYDKLPDMPDEAKLQSLVEELSNYLRRSDKDDEGRGVTRDDIFRALQNFDGDVSHQFAALDVIAEYFAGIDEGLDAAIEDARREFESEEIARDVRAGFAVAQIAHEQSHTLESNPAIYRETYRRMLREKKHMGQLFDDLCDFDRTLNFEEIIRSFIEAAGRDLSNSIPSMDENFLNALLTELNKLKQINTVYQLSGTQLTRLSTILHENEKIKISKDDLTSRLLHFCSKAAPSVSDATKFVENLALVSPKSRILLANCVKALFDLLPDSVLPSEQSREAQNSALLSWLSILVAEEERAYTS